MGDWPRQIESDSGTPEASGLCWIWSRIWTRIWRWAERQAPFIYRQHFCEVSAQFWGKRKINQTQANLKHQNVLSRQRELPHGLAITSRYPWKVLLGHSHLNPEISADSPKYKHFTIILAEAKAIFLGKIKRTMCLSDVRGKTQNVTMIFVDVCFECCLIYF